MKVDLIFQYEKSEHQSANEFPCRIHAMDEIMYPELIAGLIPNNFPMDKMWRIEKCWFHIELGKICQTAILHIYD